MSDLFPIEPSLSPKLRWLRENHLATWQDASGWFCGTPGRTIMAHGDTEEEACLAWCESRGIKHWTVQEHEARQ